MSEIFNPWIVYGIIEPRDESVIYVGITQNIKRRLWEHLHSSQSAVFGLSSINHCIFGAFASEVAARHLENSLIIALPRLYNRTHWTAGLEFWSDVRDEELRACQNICENGPWRNDKVEGASWYRRQRQEKPKGDFE